MTNTGAYIQKNEEEKGMKHKRCLTALAAAGMIGAMALGTAVTSYAADGWTKTNDHWTYINQGKAHTGWLQTSEGYYYMDLSTGYMTTGFKQIDGKWYFFRPGGLMAKYTLAELLVPDT